MTFLSFVSEHCHMRRGEPQKEVTTFCLSIARGQELHGWQLVHRPALPEISPRRVGGS